jgi:O-antigen chain-terminating methyltransferase
MAEQSVVAEGAEVDDGMLSRCRGKGLHVTEEDALDALERRPDESYDIVSAFHLIEHMPFSQVQGVLREAKRVLRPGGILILETPNPENLVGGSSSFYTDPTHRGPLPPSLLAFLSEYYGFFRQRVLRLNEPEHLQRCDKVKLWDVLFEASPDYAVVAQRGGTSNEVGALDDVFAMEVGKTLGELVTGFDDALEEGYGRVAEAERVAAEKAERIDALEQSLNERKKDLRNAEKVASRQRDRAENVRVELAKSQEALRAEKTRSEEARQRVAEERERAETLWAELVNEKTQSQWLEDGWNEALAEIEKLNDALQNARDDAAAVERELQDVYASKSWWVTWPLRKAMLAVKCVMGVVDGSFRAVPLTLKTGGARMCQMVASVVIKQTWLRTRVIAILNKMPRLKMRLRRFAIDRGLWRGGPQREPSEASTRGAVGGAEPSDAVDHPTKKLSRRGQRIFEEVMAHARRDNREAG